MLALACCVECNFEWFISALEANIYLLGLFTFQHLASVVFMTETREEEGGSPEFSHLLIPFGAKFILLSRV